MKTLDLHEAIPATIDELDRLGETISVDVVLETLGVAMVPSLQPTARAGLAPEGGELGCLGRFQLLAELGQGGMGRVLEARDPELRRSVAVKVIANPRWATEARLARFVAEAQITSQLEHPSIVPVHEMGITLEGDLFFVMKKVEGRTLRSVLSALGRGDPDTVAEWSHTKLLNAFVRICNAVAYAHDRGVLHRDLKPENVMLGAFGEVLVVDWGVARLMDDTTEVVSSEAIEMVSLSKTVDGSTIGTPGYMSPEQARGDLQGLDGRSDVWSLGAILYEVLTFQAAYPDENPYTRMFAVMAGAPADPRERAPARSVPDELAEVCLQAMATDRDERTRTAADLAAAVEDFLAGSKRREAALRHVAEAEEAWDRYCALADEREELLARERALDASIPPWAPLEQKAELRAVRRRLAGIGSERTDRFTEVLAACEKAQSQDPGNDAASALLARVHYARFEEAEAARDEQAARFHEQRTLLHDDGRWAALLKGTGALTLHTDPPGAEVVCERYDTSADLVWPLVERRVLGSTPLVELPLEQGSYLLTLRCPGRRDARYPMFITRGRRWDSGEVPVRLYADSEIGEGLVYVPPGPCIRGGDAEAQESLPRRVLQVDAFFLSVSPVTMQGYCDFINAVHARDPEEAWSRLPRQEAGIKSSGGQYWDRPGPGEIYRVPEMDRDGDRWDPAWAVAAISWEDAVACAAWRSERDGIDWYLPSELQWEKAARGVDGRVFPWGNGFDPALCKMRSSRPGRPQPEVVGAFAADVSPYGVKDLAGGMRDWCGDVRYGDDTKRRPMRGGSWITLARSCRAAHRNGLEPWIVSANHGFRLARNPPAGD